MSGFTDENGNVPLDPRHDKFSRYRANALFQDFVLSEVERSRQTQQAEAGRVEMDHCKLHLPSPSPQPNPVDEMSITRGRNRRRWPSVTPDRHARLPSCYTDPNGSGGYQQARDQPRSMPNYLAERSRPLAVTSNHRSRIGGFCENTLEEKFEEDVSTRFDFERSTFTPVSEEFVAKIERTGSAWEMHQESPVGIFVPPYGQCQEAGSTEADRGFGSIPHPPSFYYSPVSGNDSRFSRFSGMHPFETLSASASERRSHYERRHERKRRYGSTVDDVRKASDAAVNMSLDEVIMQNNITYSRNRSAKTNCRAGFNEPYASKKSRMMTHSYEDMDMDDESNSSFTTSSSEFSRNRGRVSEREARQVIIDGSNVAFEYGNNIWFDWEGIEMVVTHFLELGCSDIKVVVPEERVRITGMSKNEHVIKNLNAGHHLLPAWESRDEKIFIVKSAYRKNGIIVSNNIWKHIKTDRYKKLKNFTLKYEFHTWPAKASLKTPGGQPLEDILWR